MYTVSLSVFILSMPGYNKQHLWLKRFFSKYDISEVKFLPITGNKTVVESRSTYRAISGRCHKGVISDMHLVFGTYA